jgi:hypothetical protein
MYEQFVIRVSLAVLSLKQSGLSEQSKIIIIGPGSNIHVFRIYSNEDHVEEILSVHQRFPITIHVQGRTLLIEHAENRPYSLVLWGTP